MRRMKLSDIKINKAFANSIPKENKMAECRDNWRKYHKQDRYVVINRDNFLIDGYIQYLILKENNIEEAVVKISNKPKNHHNRINIKDWNIPYYKNRTTTYIYGIHQNQKEKKQYIWRVPRLWKGWERDLLPGDKILVHTKYGIRPIIITKIQWLDKCPVDFSVKKVFKKIKK